MNRPPELNPEQQAKMLKAAYEVCKYMPTMSFNVLTGGINFDYEYGTMLKTAMSDITEEFPKSEYKFTVLGSHTIFVEPK